MCLNPRKIINPKRKFSQAGGHKLYITIPCGKCAECQKKKVDEYMLRAYYEAYDTFVNGGFVLNDTLTYKPSNLPHISDFEPSVKGTPLDFMCFSHDDFRLFFVRLRRCLSRLGIKVAGNIKYFLAAEYGTSPNHRHQPHLHVLFFVRGGIISPLHFSRLVAQCWPYGRTDGLPYKSSFYVTSKRLFSFDHNQDLVHLQNVVTYVCKYLVKDSSFEDTIQKRISSILKNKYPDGIKSDIARQFRATLLRNVSQFHRQSQGFGLAALKYVNYDDIFDTGMMSLPDRHNVTKHIPLPTYFARKLFYYQVKDFRGLPCWQLNDEGIHFKLNHVCNSIYHLALHFDSWFTNLPNICPDCIGIRSRVLDLLSGRTFQDLARYILCYKGALIPFDSKKSLQSTFSPPLDEWLNLCLTESHSVYLNNLDLNGFTKVVSFNHYDDGKFSTRQTLDSALHSRQPIFDEVKLPFEDYKPTYYIDTRRPDGIPIDVYTRLRVIDEKTYADFVDFDVIYNLYASSLIIVNNSKQNAHELKQQLLDTKKRLMSGEL